MHGENKLGTKAGGAGGAGRAAEPPKQVEELSFGKRAPVHCCSPRHTGPSVTVCASTLSVSVVEPFSSVLRAGY